MSSNTNPKTTTNMNTNTLFTLVALCLFFVSCGEAPQPAKDTSAATAPAPASDAALTPAQVTERIRHSRAVEAVIWGMPAVNTDLMLQEMLGKTRP